MPTGGKGLRWYHVVLVTAAYVWLTGLYTCW
jgi:hypothetical protein